MALGLSDQILLPGIGTLKFYGCVATKPVAEQPETRG